MKSTDIGTAAKTGPSARQLIFAVLWSFFGVRKMANLTQDMQKLRPQWLILTAVIAAATFIGVLLTLVKFAISILAA
ncbi:DUF2970 domain-containing protein [Undibacterium sp.]|jgi:amino acid transporter|uniref:DUF2970 domain-containing protein n=1 Tax=Undibacterium sp. TaxID=1914977 RepID=UPI002CB7D935|nr:DUF2970 domain-containing protein [Undibacterium sp.]HTD04205.1 DUF2970 domain-containing protein [Undibacterium sp.]